MSNDSRSSARPVRKCMLQRTDHRKSSQRRNSLSSSGVEHAALDQLLDVAHAIDVFGDPEQRVQVAQAALAVLDVRLDQIARLAGAAVALLALGELGGDEIGAGALHDLLVEARHQLVEQLACRRAGSAIPGWRCGSSCPPWPGGCIRRSSAWRGRPSGPGPTGNRGSPRRPTRPRRSACRAAGTADRCRSPAPSGRGRSRRSRRSPCARLRTGCPTDRDAGPTNSNSTRMMSSCMLAEPLGAAAALAILQQHAARRAGAPGGQRDLEPLRDRAAQLLLGAAVLRRRAGRGRPRARARRTGRSALARALSSVSMRHSG